ncbi:MAG TPA: hypothetical protein VFV50_05325 [Bdellovibrionales bacterium]|nr:hypothetical protein [Bdellovibrionales bacterium]
MTVTDRDQNTNRDVAKASDAVAAESEADDFAKSEYIPYVLLGLILLPLLVMILIFTIMRIQV